MELFPATFRRILDVFSMQALWKIYWRNFTINASQNEAVCREVQTHFGTSPLARFIKKLMGEISRFIRLKTNLFAMKLRRIWKFSPCKKKSFIKHFWVHFHVFCVQSGSCWPWNSNTFWKFSASKVYGESSVRIFTINAPQKEGDCFEVHTHFRSSLPVRFTEKVMSTLSRFMRPKTMPFAAKFRHTLEVLRLQGLQKKVLGAISRFVCLTNKHSWLQHFVKNFGHVFQFYEPINLCCVVRTHCDVLNFHIL